MARSSHNSSHPPTHETLITRRLSERLAREYRSAMRCPTVSVPKTNLCETFSLTAALAGWLLQGNCLSGAWREQTWPELWVVDLREAVARSARLACQNFRRVCQI